ncbi:MAG: hypothetical protein ACJ8C4_15300 [Gemmataceae bacterium]
MKRWTAEQLEKSNWFSELLGLINVAVQRRSNTLPDRRSVLHDEALQLKSQIRGWSLSLANNELSPMVRRRIEVDMGNSLTRLTDIETEIEHQNALAANSTIEISTNDVADRLNRLADTLAAEDPTRTNLELSLHIDRVIAFKDGRVVVRTCRLGALAEAIDPLVDSPARSTQHLSAADGTRKSIPRRRARLRVSSFDEDGNCLDDAAYFVSDVHRFAGLGPEWFVEDVFQIPEPTFWAKENAAAVGSRRKAGLTHQELSKEFGVSPPTIRHALRIASETDEALRNGPRKMDRVRWPEEHYQEVAALRHQGKSLKELMEHFHKSQPLISRALRLAGIGCGKNDVPSLETKNSA